MGLTRERHQPLDDPALRAFTSVSLVAGIGLRGVSATVMLRRSMKRDAFESCVESMVLPERRQGDVVLWDNLGAHARIRVRALIENAVVRVVFVPLYGCDTNPSELAWLRTHAARTWEMLVDAVADALSQLTTRDICHEFETYGYHAQQQGKRSTGE